MRKVNVPAVLARKELARSHKLPEWVSSGVKGSLNSPSVKYKNRNCSLCMNFDRCSLINFVNDVCWISLDLGPWNISVAEIIKVDLTSQYDAAQQIIYDFLLVFHSNYEQHYSFPEWAKINLTMSKCSILSETQPATGRNLQISNTAYSTSINTMAVVTLLGFCHDVWYNRTRLTWLLGSTISSPCSAIMTELSNVRDTQTDRQNILCTCIRHSLN